MDTTQARVGAALKKGWKRMWPQFWMLLVVLILYGILTAPGQAFQYEVSPGETIPPYVGPMVALSTIYSVFVGIPLGLGLAYAALKAARGADVEVGDVFAGFRVYLNGIGGMVLMGLAIIGGLILLIIPGIWIALRLAFVPFLLVDEKLRPVDAIKASWETTRGHALRLFGLALASIGIVILGLLALIVGVFPAILWVYTSFAVYYETVHSRVSPATSAPPAGVAAA